MYTPGRLSGPLNEAQRVKAQAILCPAGDDEILRTGRGPPRLGPARLAVLAWDNGPEERCPDAEPWALQRGGRESFLESGRLRSSINRMEPHIFGPSRPKSFPGSRTKKLRSGFLARSLLRRRACSRLLRCAWSADSTYSQTRLRRPPGARLESTASPPFRDGTW